MSRKAHDTGRASRRVADDKELSDRIAELRARRAATSDAEIAKSVAADPDAAPIADEAWFDDAGLVEPAGKVLLSLRIDRDVVDFFRSSGPGYQTRMNRVLRAFKEHEQRRRQKGRA